ncbi:MAG: S4 domain-containing protein, partial [Thermomicrobiales bacterium]
MVARGDAVGPGQERAAGRDKKPGSKQRLDEALVDRALVATRSRAKAVVMAGDVLVNGAVVIRAGWLVQPGDGLA